MELFQLDKQPIDTVCGLARSVTNTKKIKAYPEYDDKFVMRQIEEEERDRGCWVREILPAESFDAAGGHYPGTGGENA